MSLRGVKRQRNDEAISILGAKYVHFVDCFVPRNRLRPLLGGVGVGTEIASVALLPRNDNNRFFRQPLILTFSIKRELLKG